jgi:hypothetical protein
MFVSFFIQEKQLEPHYAVLPDQTESEKIQMYVSQDDIEIVNSRKVLIAPLFQMRMRVDDVEGCG